MDFDIMVCMPISRANSNYLLLVLYKLLIVGSSAPSHNVFGILIIVVYIWHF